MSRRTIRLGLAGTVLLVALSVAIAAAVAGASAGASAPERQLTVPERQLTLPDRQLTLVARGMGFYLPGGEEANPTLRLAPGERVEVRLVNREPGVLHDLLVEELGFEIPAFREAGERVAVLQAPMTPGRYEYLCSLHRRMMRGVIVVGGAGVETSTR
ncbi:MAG TPA: hypothetical protein VMT85_22490 [Thermoanaerobaculia bacterium]|nr:hypothetical protein [Thermoanaerobaculia bacterium]